MKYIKSFEKFGILKGLEEQVDEYMKVIQSNPDKNNFDFIYNCDDIKYDFKLKILKIKANGMFHMSDEPKLEFDITLVNRTSKSVLLHEVKHLDYYIRKRNCFDDIFFIANKKLTNLSTLHPLKYIQNVFYLYDENEFQSRYHEYYVEFDKYIECHKKENMIPNDILVLFFEFLNKNKELSWTWYLNDKEFKFENYISKRLTYQLFNQYIYDTDFYMDEFNNIFNYLKTNIKKLYKSTFSSYTDKEMSEILKLKKKFENKINNRLPKYRKKMFRLVTLMVDKWIDI